jgi:hypothetical protein
MAQPSISLPHHFQSVEILVEQSSNDWKQQESIGDPHAIS